jgi:hypothetical protein
LAQAAREVVAVAGRACVGAVIGILATPNEEGKLSTDSVAKMAQRSASNIRHNRLEVERGHLGTFGNQNMVQHVTRVSVTDIETVGEHTHTLTHTHTHTHTYTHTHIYTHTHTHAHMVHTHTHTDIYNIHMYSVVCRKRCTLLCTRNALRGLGIRKTSAG